MAQRTIGIKAMFTESCEATAPTKVRQAAFDLDRHCNDMWRHSFYSLHIVNEQIPRSSKATFARCRTHPGNSMFRSGTGVPTGESRQKSPHGSHDEGATKRRYSTRQSWRAGSCTCTELCSVNSNISDLCSIKICLPVS